MNIQNLINSSTSIIVLKRALHIISLAQKDEKGVKWNAGTITDLLSIEEKSELNNKIAIDAINKAKNLFDDSYIETKQGGHAIRGKEIPHELLSELVQFYTNFVVIDHIRKKSIDLLIKKHNGTALWLLARLHFAIAANMKCEVLYSSLGCSEPQKYLVHPYHIAINKNSFYLISLREKDGNIGLFPLHRIDDLTVIESIYTEDIPNIEEIFKNSFGSFVNDKVYDFEIEYHSDVSRIIEENFFHLNPQIDKIDEICSAKFRASDMEDICRELFYYGNRVKIKSPQKARDMMRNMCEEIIEVYR